MSVSKHKANHELQMQKLGGWKLAFHLKEKFVHFPSVLFKKSKEFPIDFSSL